MKKYLYAILVPGFIFQLCIPLFCQESEMKTVSSLDLQRYLGVWYEIARLPNRFQKACRKNTAAEYRLNEDSTIAVINTCTKENGDIITARGRAKIVDGKTKAKLKVSFVRFLGKNLFWGNYWVIGLDRDYQWAVVGEPSRKYGWILSRRPALSSEDRQAVNAVLQEQGYDPDQFIHTLQEPGETGE